MGGGREPAKSVPEGLPRAGVGMEGRLCSRTKGWHWAGITLGGLRSGKSQGTQNHP